jgi:DNA-binding NarL/FixJ family response regulator
LRRTGADRPGEGGGTGALPPATLPPPSLTDVEQAWLRRLAAGGTVAGLARGCGYSEREMYRRLSDMYSRLGARTRTEALLLAERFGLLDTRV